MVALIVTPTEEDGSVWFVVLAVSLAVLVPIILGLLYRLWDRRSENDATTTKNT